MTDKEKTSYIKEYIDYEILKCAVTNYKGNLYYDKTAIKNFLEKIKSMLDELEEKKEIIKGFTVIDTKTGRYPDVENIALKEDWAKDLIYCDIEGFAIQEDGSLILTDECGNYANCPLGRFKIKPIYYI